MNKLSQTPRTYGDIMAINVDVQNDFARPDGALSVKGGEEVIEPLNSVNSWVREQGGGVVFTADWHPKQTAHFEEFGGTWPVHCVADTEGALLHDNLTVETWDTFATKGTSTVDDGYSGLEAVPQTGWLADPDLDGKGYTISDAILDSEATHREHKTRLVIAIGGLATDFCVKATVLDALRVTDRSVTDIVLLRDAIRAVNLEPDAGDKAIAAMIEAGALAMSTQEITRGGIVIDSRRLES